MNEFDGLTPSAWICVDQGYVREEIKALLLGRSRGIVGAVVSTPQSLAMQILGPEIQPERILSRAARQEALKQLLEENLATGLFTELKRLRRQRRFWERLDQAIQNARLAFAHWDEERVIDERLNEAVGVSLTRQETRRLAFLWEAWLVERRLWDLPRLLREATERLRVGSGPLEWPTRLYWLRAGVVQALEEQFWAALGATTEVIRGWPPFLAPQARGPASVSWERWHTLDDAAEAIAERLCQDSAEDSAEELERVAVLIHPSGEVRRSLKRALEQRGLELEDARDPNRIRWDEGLKWALSPLEVVARDFDRKAVLSWIERGVLGASEEERRRWTREIQERGIVRGLHSYRGGRLESVAKQLEALNESFGGRATLRQLAERHLKELERQSHTRVDARLWRDYFQSFWDAFIRDERLLASEGEVLRPQPLRSQWERVQSRIRAASPPVERLRPDCGVRVYRLGQELSREVERVWVLGLDPRWLESEEVGDLWYSGREREWVASEFGVKSRSRSVEASRESLKRWIGHAAQVTFMDAQFAFSGAERESLGTLLERELGLQCSREDRGAHSRWMASYGALPRYRASEVRLAPLEPGTEGKVILTATAVDQGSECGFKALATTRWKLWDGRESQPELWAHVRGRILHAAAERWVRQPTLTVNDALEQAWEAEPPRGLLRSERLTRYAKDQLRAVLEVFVEKERAYAERSGARPLVLEDQAFSLEVDERIQVQGKPDRIDEHPSGGLFAIDYKSGAQQTRGIDMIERGQRLQLAIYGLAASRTLGRPLLGLQFVELTRAGTRTKGVFLKAWNGKESGKLTDTRSNNLSLTTMDESELWGRLEGHIHRVARALASGTYDARPVDEGVCPDCAQRDLCGQRRRVHG